MDGDNQKQLSKLLREAVTAGDPTTVRELIKKGADIQDCLDSSHNTVLHLASQAGHKEVVELLLKNGADPKAVNSRRESPLHLASHNGHSQAVQLLHQYGADIHATNKWGDTPLHVASSAGQTETVRSLLQLGADAGATNEVLATPLHVAAYFGKERVVSVLLSAGVEVDVKDGTDNTPLHHASANSYSNTVVVLLQHGADPFITNSKGKTSLDVARNSDVRRLLTAPQVPHININHRRSYSSPQLLHVKPLNKRTSLHVPEDEEKELLRQFHQQLQVEKALNEKQGSAQPKGKLQARIAALSKDKELQEARLRIQQLEDEVELLRLQVAEEQPYWIVDKDEIVMTDEIIGRGGWGEVRVASFRGLRVAAKCLYEGIVSGYNIRLFSREMNMAAKARHPNLLQFIGATTEGRPIILTELMPTSLRRELEQHHFTQEQILRVSCDVACALNYLHLWKPKPIIHRDVSSGNVLLEPSGNNSIWKAKLSDYGSANFVHSTVTANPGNPAYSAPEATNPQLQTPKMDCYSFGVLLIEMTLGEFPGSTPLEKREQISRIQSPAILQVIKQCTNTDIGARPSTGTILRMLSSII